MPKKEFVSKVLPTPYTLKQIDVMKILFGNYFAKLLSKYYGKRNC
jgi:hypothetical protein